MMVQEMKYARKFCELRSVFPSSEGARKNAILPTLYILGHIIQRNNSIKNVVEGF